MGAFKSQSLRKILFVSFALLFTLPLLIFFYNVEYYHLLNEIRTQVSFIIILCFSLAGFVILRQIVDQVIALSTKSEEVVSKAGVGIFEKDQNELVNLASSFEKLLTKLEDNTTNLEKRVAELSSLHELTHICSKKIDMKQLLEAVLEKLMIVTDSTAGMMLSVSEDRKCLHVKVVRGIEEHMIRHHEIEAGKTISGSVLIGSKVIISENIADEPEYNPEVDNIFEGPFIAKALSARGKVVGVLNLARNRDTAPYLDENINYINTALGQISYAFDNAQLIAELKNVVSEIKTLRGIIPICSYCKKIRTDQGAWEQLEEYIVAHSDAKFSHGICPECMKRISSELNQDSG